MQIAAHIYATRPLAVVLQLITLLHHVVRFGAHWLLAANVFLRGVTLHRIDTPGYTLQDSALFALAEASIGAEFLDKVGAVGP